MMILRKIFGKSLTRPQKFASNLNLRFSSSTIFAPCSGSGKCGVSVIRVSGKSSSVALQTLTRRQTMPEARKASLRKLFDPTSGLVLDHALVLWFPAPASFTGEDSCELHVHGGPAVVRAVLAALSDVSKDLRPALPGEFTRRAFHSGKLDLTQVEGLSDLIHAETEQQRRLALRQMDGTLYKKFQEWRARLIKVVADVEAFIDFSESEDIESDVLDRARDSAEQLLIEFSKHLNDAKVGERLRDGVHLAIIGEPNVGKSSLLNHLLQRPAAIVSPIAGTTRDLLETQLDFGGFPVNICDTAGLRTQTSDTIEKEGIFRAINAASKADLIVHVIDVRHLSLTKSFEKSFSEVFDASRRVVKVVNKIDLLPEWNNHKSVDLDFVSLKTGEGLEDLNRRLQAEVENLCQTQGLGESALLTRNRHRFHLKKALGHLETFLDFDSGDVVVSAEHLRKAIREVGFVTGKVSSEKILDVIFSDFCIGK